MPSIDIDFEVYKILTSHRATESVSYNDVIRKLLKLPTASAPPAQLSKGAWHAGHVIFPEGTEFRVTYKGRNYTAKVAGGHFVMNGKIYASLSNAAIAITGTNVNGWNFWSARLPGEVNFRKANSCRPGRA